jgi:hypothetical protein
LEHTKVCVQQILDVFWLQGFWHGFTDWIVGEASLVRFRETSAQSKRVGRDVHRLSAKKNAIARSDALGGVVCLTAQAVTSVPGAAATTHYTTEQGLASNHVYAILEERKGLRRG